MVLIKNKQKKMNQDKEGKLSKVLYMSHLSAGRSQRRAYLEPQSWWWTFP